MGNISQQTAGFADRANQNNKQNFQTRGALIMQIADILRPMIADWLKGAKDRNGMQLQPARIRAIALNAAQDLVKNHA